MPLSSRPLRFIACLIAGACSSNSSSAPARQLAFSVEPGSGFAGQAFVPPVAVELEDANGGRTGASASVSIHLLAGGSAGSLIGTTTQPASAGVATFSDLGLNSPGGYSLVATSPGLDSAVSRSFLITRAATDRWVEVGTATHVRQFRSTTNGTVNPAVDTIARGDLVIWSWLDDGHSVQSTGDPSFTSSVVLISTATYVVQFDTPGTYQYICGVHGAAMSGRVVVQ
ncbi:MAG: plastocyanin/azurin family copper-binding protein [Gemmatimonadales bacterium]